MPRWAGFDDILSGNGSWFILNDTATVQHGRWCEAVKSPEGLTMFGHWGDPGGVQVNFAIFGYILTVQGRFSIDL